MIDIRIQGAKALERKLLDLQKKVGKKIVRQAVRKGAKEIQGPAKSNARSMIGGEMGGLIARHIIVRKQKKRVRDGAGINVMMRPGQDAFVHVTKSGVRHYIPSAIEYGHAAPYQGTRRMIRGKTRKVYTATTTVPAIPFFRRAWDTHKNRALNITLQAIAEGIEKAAKQK